MSNAISSPSALFTTHAHSTPIQILSVARLGIGLGAFIAPAFFSQTLFGFQSTANKTSNNNTVNSTSVKAGSPEELSVAIRLFGVRDIGLGLLLRDSASAVVERALQIGLIVDLLGLVSAGFGFVEGTLSQEIATAVGTVAAVFAGVQAYVLNR
ncbi:hypothetical protein CROQUDRAFT_315484 [Cronartium quercuum f. sp. fusiforme G11]|uniref:Uncharacterized protein n=1 Tax=Cronartium quercuum f. sp. fusiforme G11 TaxID=708437 RepID=A0A9P6NXM0_9BASI|nr:hypothetical protein CROQUDRAFT_315484 [Cronartium quercuum f. sp. fusiforme G11]